MAPHPPDSRPLEEAFFARENTKLLERLREKAERDQRREALRGVIPKADEALLDHLDELGVRPETALAIMIVPLTMVAWADGSLDPKERRAILLAAEERGLAPDGPAHALLVSWLDTKPNAQLVEAWRRYVRSIWSELTDEECAELRDRMLGFARDVAEAAGGFLGLVNRISPEEQATLDDIAATLG